MNTLSAGTKGQLTLLDMGAQPMDVEVKEVCGVQLYLRLGSAIRFAAPVKVETAGALLLGDVTHCDAQPTGFLAGVTVRHMLTVLPELNRLGHKLTEEADLGRQHSTSQEYVSLMPDLLRLNAMASEGSSVNEHSPVEERAGVGMM